MINILITGASSDIGYAIAERFAFQHYVGHLGLHYHSNRERLIFVDKKIKLFKSDFSGNKKITLVKDFLKAFGRIDVLINCAGIMTSVSFEHLTAAEYDRIMNINSRSAYMITRDAFNNMKKHGGKIINISSVATKFGMGRNHSIHYAASKATLDILTIGLANMGAKYNILVNSISPGVIDTKSQKNRCDINERKNLIPLKRLGTVDDVAYMAEYLVSSKGNFITGQNIGVSGGE